MHIYPHPLRDIVRVCLRAYNCISSILAAHCKYVWTRPPVPRFENRPLVTTLASYSPEIPRFGNRRGSPFIILPTIYVVTRAIVFSEIILYRYKILLTGYRCHHWRHVRIILPSWKMSPYLLRNSAFSEHFYNNTCKFNFQEYLFYNSILDTRCYIGIRNVSQKECHGCQ